MIFGGTKSSFVCRRSNIHKTSPCGSPNEPHGDVLFKILPIIERWYKDSKGPLYPRPDGKPYNKDTFSNGVWKPCMKSLGLPDDLTPHSARHTLGTRMSAAGARPEDIQRIMGHADYSMTANTYIAQDDSTLKNAIELLA